MKRTITASEVLKAFSDQDLVSSLPESYDNELFVDYTNRCRDEISHCGDSIFKFIAFEIQDVDNRMQYMRRINRGAKDLLAFIHDMTLSEQD